MKVNLIEVERPMFKSFTLFADPNLSLLKEKKVIRVSAYNITKTRVSTDISFGNYCTKVNLPILGFKTHESTEYNMFSGRQTTSNYFVKSKKQSFEMYKEYVKEVVTKVINEFFKIDLDEVTIELEKGGF